MLVFIKCVNISEIFDSFPVVVYDVCCMLLNYLFSPLYSARSNIMLIIPGYFSEESCFQTSVFSFVTIAANPFLWVLIREVSLELLKLNTETPPV